MEESLQIFNFESTEIRTQLIDDEPWFVGKDIAEILGYERTADAIRIHVDEEDKGVCEISTPGGTQLMNIINESGLYSLILKSKLPTAKKFKRWVTKEVLPSIRKNGGYQVSNDPWDTLTLMFEASKQTKEEVDEVKTRVINLEENVSIDPGKYSYIGRRISQKVRQVGKERKWTMNKKQLALLYKDLNKAVAEVSGVRTRAQLREKHFDKVMDLIDDWEPSTATRMLIHNLEDDDVFQIAEDNKR